MKKKMPDDVMDYFRKQGRKGGKIGGKARAEALTPERRSEIAKKAAVASAKARKAKAKKSK